MLGLKSKPALRRPSRSQIALLLAAVGPGIIVATADNDASGIYGYAMAGAQYRYSLLWILALVTVSLGVCQEIGARMGAVTGKGLADLIREEYGVKVTLFAMATLLLANYATIVSEFAGITAAVEMFTSPQHRLLVRWIVVPVVAAAVWLLITRGSYRRVERILLGASLIYLAYIASAFMAHPPWGEVLRATAIPSFRSVRLNAAYLFMVINVVGTTITPWGQFYIQSSIRDKGLRTREYSVTRGEVLFGAFFTNLIAFFIIVCCGATLFVAGHPPSFDNAGEIAVALRPIAGPFAAILFAIGLFNASCFGAVTVPISTAYAITESLGTESGLGRRAHEAPLFIAILSFLIPVSALTVLLGGQSLALLIILPNIVGGILLPVILVLSLRLVNNPQLMGSYCNSRVYNIIAWATTYILIALSVVLAVTALFPGLTGGS
ncbi:MAG TPA: divalent metal cation transporter [Chthonomonadales bacterium]|nr:divalent metal cation transporter [Chthonomonadales bacterium]